MDIIDCYVPIVDHGGFRGAGWEGVDVVGRMDEWGGGWHSIEAFFRQRFQGSVRKVDLHLARGWKGWKTPMTAGEIT